LAYALQQHALEAASHGEAEGTQFAVVATATVSKKSLAEDRSSSPSAKASADLADSPITAKSRAATVQRIPRAMAEARDFTVDTKIRPDLAPESVDQVVAHAASTLDVEAVFDHALGLDRTGKLSPEGATAIETRIDNADTRKHAGLETVDDARVSEHFLDRFDLGATRWDLAQEIVWITAEANKKAATAPASNPPGNMAHEPLVLVVSLRDQRLDAYRGSSLLVSSKISSGKAGYDTRTGVFSILEKKRFHHSNLYSNAPMPWMQRLTRSGTALHAGAVPGYPASHGCIRLPFSFAPKLFEMTEVGANVVIANDRITPVPIEHSLLFQPWVSRVLMLTPAQASNAIGLAQNESGALTITDAAHASDALLSARARAHAVDPAGYANSETGAAKSIINVLDRENTEPLRILVTKQTERDKIIAVQNMLASMGYLERQRFTGKLGDATIAAIRAFQKANGVRATGAFTNEFATLVYAIAGTKESPAGRIFVRQDFHRVFDAPVEILDSDKALGTHAFIATQGDAAKFQWFAIRVDGDDSAAVLDRIVIPSNIREAIERKLGLGSSLIVSDIGVDSAILPEGDDFLVLAKSASSATVAAKPKPAVAANKPTKIKKLTQAAPKRRSKKVSSFSTSRSYRYPTHSFSGGLFSGW
jgi:peptidoglycan hydrolase-like protein with peptidoglycan-binding domain